MLKSYGFIESTNIYSVRMHLSIHNHVYNYNTTDKTLQICKAHHQNALFIFLLGGWWVIAYFVKVIFVLPP